MTQGVALTEMFEIPIIFGDHTVNQTIQTCSPVATHIKGADELLICAMPAAKNVNIIHLLFALQPML